MSKVSSAFKQLYSEMFNVGGDFSKVSKEYKKPLKCYVKESFPHFLVTDGFFFVPAYFTKQAIEEFRNKFGNVNVTDLRDKVIVLNTWHLEMRKVNSAEIFTSYMNLEARLVVTSLKPNLQEKLNPTRYPINLFRDNEMKLTIQHFVHQNVQRSVSKASSSLPDIAKIGADGKKARVEAQGVVTLKGGDKDFGDYTFKEGNTSTLRLQDIFVQENQHLMRKDELKKLDEGAGTARVKSTSKGKKKTAASKAKKPVKKSADAADVRKQVTKILKYTPSKSVGKKDNTPQKGKASTKRLSSRTPMASPGGKKSTRTTDQMTMAQFK